VADSRIYVLEASLNLPVLALDFAQRPDSNIFIGRMWSSCADSAKNKFQPYEMRFIPIGLLKRQLSCPAHFCEGRCFCLRDGRRNEDP
jgi:hypothetical protein